MSELKDVHSAEIQATVERHEKSGTYVSGMLWLLACLVSRSTSARQYRCVAASRARSSRLLGKCMRHHVQSFNVWLARVNVNEASYCTKVGGAKDPNAWVEEIQWLMSNGVFPSRCDSFSVWVEDAFCEEACDELECP